MNTCKQISRNTHHLNHPDLIIHSLISFDSSIFQQHIWLDKTSYLDINIQIGRKTSLTYPTWVIDNHSIYTWYICPLNDTWIVHISCYWDYSRIIFINRLYIICRKSTLSCLLGESIYRLATIKHIPNPTENRVFIIPLESIKAVLLCDYVNDL